MIRTCQGKGNWLFANNSQHDKSNLKTVNASTCGYNGGPHPGTTNAGAGASPDCDWNPLT
jgi:hypothetical protein